MHPPGTTEPLRDFFESGLTMSAFVAHAEANADLWRNAWRRAEVPGTYVRRVEALPCPWKLLVMAADWCGDAVNIVPVVGRLAERCSNLDLRVLDRDAHPALRESHLTNGTSRSIPVIMLLDERFVERGWWGPRPAALQSWVVEQGMALEKPERYRLVRRWYVRDRGASVLEELVMALEQAAAALSPADCSRFRMAA